MRPIAFASIAFLSASVVFASSMALAQPPAQKSPASEPARARIVPVVVVRPGEKAELLLSTVCAVGATRSGGLDIREISGEARQGFDAAKKWQQNGVTVQVPDWGEAAKEAAAPHFAMLKKSGVNAFRVTVSAAKDASPGVYNLHLADFTCNGTCETDFRILVATK